MKKLIYTINTVLIAFLFTGCDTSNKIYTEDSYDIVTIEGCEYVKLKGNSYQSSLAHKGNCKSDVHKYTLNNN